MPNCAFASRDRGGRVANSMDGVYTVVINRYLGSGIYLSQLNLYSTEFEFTSQCVW